MAHYALIDPDTMIVVEVFVGVDETATSHDWESVYATGSYICRRTSYNTLNGTHPKNRPFRHNYAGVGYLYWPDLDIFTPPPPKPWYVLSADYEWKCPDNLHPDTGNPLTEDELLIRRLHNNVGKPIMPLDIEEW